ncbi:hypothetical protein F5141DRAFT_395050 [Pisolithus sp. B1]|nr:hypothetical protein F5141DRAFT_395050 [Pisolithus sp. B1]
MSGSLSTVSAFVSAVRAGAKIASTSLLAPSSSSSKRGPQGDVLWRRGSQPCKTTAALSEILFPVRVPENGTSTGGVRSSILQFTESTDKLLGGLGLSVPDDKTFAGVLSLRDLGVLFSNSFVASADVHLHQRHNGIHVFEKPHLRQTNKGRFGQRQRVGRESEGDIVAEWSTYHDDLTCRSSGWPVRGLRGMGGQVVHED